MRSPVRAGALIAALVLASGCKDSTGVKTSDALANAQAQWQQTNIKTYDYVFSVSCFCTYAGHPVHVTVHNGAFFSAVYADTTSAAVDTSLFRDYLTVDRVFTRLRATLDANPAKFTATYDANDGYPKQVSIDYNATTVDDEFGFGISQLNNSGTP